MFCIDKRHGELYRFLEGSLLTALRNELPNGVIEDACAKHGYHYRRRLLTPVTTSFYLMASALNREASFAAVWSMLWTELAKEFSELAGRPYDSFLMCHARQRLPLAVLEEVFRYVRDRGVEAGQGYDSWCGKRMLIMDGSTTRTERTEELERYYGLPGDREGNSYFPVMRWVSMIVGGTAAVLDYRSGPYETSELELAEGLFEHLGQGDLLLADRYYASKEIQAELSGRGVDYIMQLHQRFKITSHPHARLSERDYLVKIRLSKAQQRRKIGLPEQITVRVIYAGRKRDGKPFAVITSLLDRRQYPAKKVLSCYKRRWGYETHANEVKTCLHTKRFRSKTAEGVQKELCAHLIAYNIMQVLILKAARRHRVNPRRISFTSAVRKVVHFSDAMRYAPAVRLPGMYDNLLAWIAADLNPTRRGRREPRALRDAYARYPAFRSSRSEWRRTGALRC